MATVEAELVLSVDQALQQVEQLGDLISTVTEGVNVDVGVEVDTSAAESEIAGIDASGVDVPVEADVSPAEAEIQGLQPDPIEVPLEVTGGESLPQVEETLGGAAQGAESFAGALLGAGGAARTLTAVGLGAFVTSSVSAFAEADEVIAVAQRRIESLGDSAVTSLDGIASLSIELMNTAGVSDEAATQAQTLLLTFENLSNGAITTEENFQRATRAVFDISTVQGNAQSNAIALGKALEDPVAGLGRLGRAGITFTDEQKAVIESLAETGDIAGAQVLILDEIEDKYGGLAEAAGGSLAGQLRIAGEAFGEFQEAVGEVAGRSVPLLTGGLDLLTAALAVIGPIVTAFGRGIEGIVDVLALIPTPVAIVVAAFGTLVIAARAALTAMLLLSAANPVTLALVAAATAVTALGAALGFLDDQASDSVTQLYLTADALDRIQGEAASLGRVLAEAGQAGFVDEVLTRLIDISPAVVDAITETGTSVAELIEAIQGGQVPVDVFAPLIEAAGLTGDEATEAEAALAALGLQISQAAFHADTLTDAENANAEALGTTAEQAQEAQAALEALVNTSVGNLPTLGDAIGNVEENLSTFGQTITRETDPSLVIENLAQMVDAFVNFTSNIAAIQDVSPIVAEALAPLGPEIAGGFAAALAQAPEQVTLNLQQVLQEARLAGLDLTSVLTGGAASAAEGFAGQVGRLPGAARNAAAGATREVGREQGNARSAASQFGEGFAEGTGRGARGMEPAARAAASAAVGAVRGIPGAFAAGQAVGSALTAGMASGIAVNAPDVVQAARNVVQQAIAAAEAEAGISSPSTVFIGIGEEMTEGLAIGLADSAGVVAAAESLTLAAARGAATGGGTSFGDTTIMVDARGASDPQAVADATVGALARHQRRVAALISQP